MAEDKLTTGMEQIDRLIGGVLAGDNLVWEVDSGAPVDKFVSSFISACEAEGTPVVYVSFNRSPQTIANTYGSLMSAGGFKLVDCFSSGKGNNDDVFLGFFRSVEPQVLARPIHVENPADNDQLQEVLRAVGSEVSTNARYVFDSLTGMFDLWGDEDTVLRFFGHFCPRLFDINTVAYWLLEKEAHSERFLAKLRHITQVVVEIAVSRGIRTLTLRKAVNRRCVDIGVPQWFRVVDGELVIATESREDRELGLLTRMADVLGTALEPQSFFEQTMEAMANELGMVRGTLVLLDRTANKLKIAAAHGLSAAERARGEYAIGEGVTGLVVGTGLPKIIPDVSQDACFLNRTATRKIDAAHPIAFICVPIKVDNKVVGALSIDRPFAVGSMLDKDLRLLLIVASIISQVLKINRLIHIEKEEILVRDEHALEDLRRRYRLENLVGQSEAIERVLSTAATAAKSRATILLTGETGTGKELVANVVHYNSDRSSGPFIKVNCGALPETLLESELFGHVKGAFTGALDSRKGRFELADGGTLFLDEIAEMSPRLQVKLLRVLQEKEFEPVGGTQTIHVNVRVVAATSKQLKKEIQEGRFREDLFYRLNVIPIHLPPLRERRADIPGDVGQTFLYGVKGGSVYVLGNAAGRPLINSVGRPRVVINGTCLDFLAESFMAGDPLQGGGFAILNGIEFDDAGQVISRREPYPGSNLFSLASGGAIYIRDPHNNVVPQQLNGGEFAALTQQDWDLIRPYLEENERLFGIGVDELLTVDGQRRVPERVYRKVRPIQLRALASGASNSSHEDKALEAIVEQRA